MKRYLSSFLILSLTALANAQDSPALSGAQPVSLTWQDCVQIAARNNPDLLSALAASEASRDLYLKSFNGILPQINLSHSYSDGKSGGIESKLWNAEGTASLDLIDVGQWASIQSASAARRVSEANYHVAATNALLALYKAFVGVMYTQDAIRVNTTIRDTWDLNAQMVSLRYQSGQESKGNNMNTQAQSLQAQLAVDQSNRDLHVTQQQLAQALGKDAFEALIVTGTWTTSAVPMPRPNIEALVPQQPQIQAQQASVEQANAQVNIAHSALLPTLSLSYSKGIAGPSEFPTSPYWDFGGVINYPLFAGGLTSTYYASQAAQRALDQAKQNLRSLRNQIRLTLESAWSGFAQAQDQVQAQNAFLLAAKQRKEESDVRYQSGLMTFEEWNLVIQDYVNFQQSFLRAQQNLILAEAQWRFALGEQL